MSNPILKTFDYSFLSFLKHRVNGGMVLMVVAVLAMIVANSPWAETYHAFWNHPVSLQVGGFNLFSHHGEPLTLMAFINDALMAVFFSPWVWKLSGKYWWANFPACARHCFPLSRR